LLLGIDTPTTGEVLYDGVPLATNMDRFRAVLGYVPQQDIVHPELTVRESLGHAARLRLPPNTSAAEAEARIARVLADARLEAHAQTPAGRLSGGQRKRASTAVELLSGPRILFLDEPTSGLDPGLDDQMMQSFREMADNGRTVVVTTHATRNIAICDRVVIVCGGLIVFVGTPGEALDHFDVDDFVKVYPLLENADAPRLRDAFHGTAAYARNLQGRIESSAGETGASQPEAGLLAQIRRTMRQSRRSSAVTRSSCAATG
jgi:ABC-type multidrug transport system ATPase subunit